jgi:hypothetical protein
MTRYFKLKRRWNALHTQARCFNDEQRRIDSLLVVMTSKRTNSIPRSTISTRVCSTRGIRSYTHALQHALHWREFSNRLLDQGKRHPHLCTPTR